MRYLVMLLPCEPESAETPQVKFLAPNLADIIRIIMLAHSLKYDRNQWNAHRLCLPDTSSATIDYQPCSVDVISCPIDIAASFPMMSTDRRPHSTCAARLANYHSQFCRRD